MQYQRGARLKPGPQTQNAKARTMDLRGGGLTQELRLRVGGDLNFVDGSRKVQFFKVFGTGPADLEFLDAGSRSQDLDGAVLGPIAGAGVDFANRSPMFAIAGADLGADGVWICSRATQTDAQAFGCGDVVIELRLGAILGDGKIKTAVAVVIAGSSAALFAIDFDAAGIAGQ